MQHVLDEPDERIARMRREVNGEPEYNYDEEEEEQAAEETADAFTTREYRELPALVNIYAELPQTVVLICEQARGRLREQYVQHLQIVRDALAPYGKFSEWCMAVGLFPNTVYSILRREEERSKQSFVPPHNPSPGPNPSPDPKPKPHRRTPEERAAGPTSAFVARVKALPQDGVDRDAYRALAMARLRQDDEDGFDRMESDVIQASIRVKMAGGAINDLWDVMLEVKEEFERRGE